MLNYLWGFMILIGTIFAAFTGNLANVTEAALDSAKEAVTLCITMIGVMSFWVGLMRVAERAGIIEGASKKLSPVLDFLFPYIPKDHKAREYISTNMIANFFGLGWAATPAGIKAMEELENLEEERRKKPIMGKRGVAKGIANTEMCTFLIVNISSLQLIPINIIAYRTQYGSTNPTRIVGGAILATTVSTAVGILFARIMERVKKV
ncbi:MAG: nucleoside recognition protein [Lachnospiraceae bacterium]